MVTTKKIVPTKKRAKQKDGTTDELLAKLRESKEVKNDIKQYRSLAKKLRKCTIMQKTCGTKNSVNK